jgi:hypothetical protein
MLRGKINDMRKSADEIRERIEELYYMEGCPPDDAEVYYFTLKELFRRPFWHGTVETKKVPALGGETHMRFVTDAKGNRFGAGRCDLTMGGAEIESVALIAGDDQRILPVEDGYGWLVGHGCPAYLAKKLIGGIDFIDE